MEKFSILVIDYVKKCPHLWTKNEKQGSEAGFFLTSHELIMEVKGVKALGRIILIVGGARSGKSQFAEEICRHSGKKIGYIATSEIWDEEMQRRVQLHKKRRPSSWKVWESPEGSEEILRQAREESEIILFDCLTLYLTYWMFHPSAPLNIEERESFILEKAEKMIESFSPWEGTVLFISNEVGTGIVPENALSREFRDLSGRVNTHVAKKAQEVYWVSCGLATPLKKNAAAPEEVLTSW